MATVRGIPTEMELFIASSTGKHVEAKTKTVYMEIDGDAIGILPKHQPEFYSVNNGIVKFKDSRDNDVTRILLNGFVQIEPDAVRIAVENIYEPEEINVEEVKKEIKDLKKKLSSLSTDSKAEQELKSEIVQKEFLIKKAL